ncbi:universal stress protein [Actinoplanes teichomyceticus]|uniref:Nucleotide-binding universal stress UspA family protein n=1 Tax=Actinoplanes teichomyceticus TaxID=1867 RepID=A0A561WK91_ACTTI|nr:universal stress protein [Actinoplanes teichomyceticus]TWG24282.1 nucleotide-binding universal stress UspA family protein [Actinoplanes teichomyceticus]GIF12872.1 universal stress protein [Actinoplanes teichomyceticus]
MQEKKRIVIGFDGSPAARAALMWALDEASRTNTPAELVYADEWPIWAPAASVVPSPALRPESYDRVIQQMLGDAVTDARRTHPLVEVTATAVPALTSTALVERSAGATMIVLGGGDHGILADVLGSVAAEVGAHARCPVVVVHGHPAGTEPVVAALDGSRHAPAVLRFAAGRAAARDVALRALDIRSHHSAAARGPVFDTLVDTARHEFPGLRIEAEVVSGHAADALIAAGDTAQLLVVGGRGLGAVRGLLLGSPTWRVLRHAKCPLAVVHETGGTVGAA